MSVSSKVEVEGEVIAETELAYLFSAGDEEVWLPKSQVEWDEDTETMTMPRWLAFNEGLI